MDQNCLLGGTFRFDTAAGRLWSGDGEVRLTPKAAAVLKELVTHAGAPVWKVNVCSKIEPRFDLRARSGTRQEKPGTGHWLVPNA